MSHLQPTQVTDKNGKSTTVHKRVDAPDSKTAARSLPTPKAPKTETVTMVVGTLKDIEKAAEPLNRTDGKNVVVSGPDSSVPEGYLSATAKILGIVTTYILEEGLSGKEEDAVIIGRVELNADTKGNEVYAGANIKGGGWVGSGLLMEEAVQRMISRREGRYDHYLD